MSAFIKKINNRSSLRIKLAALKGCFRVIMHGGYSGKLGFPEAVNFEQNFAAFMGTAPQQVVGTASATDAVVCALKLAGVKYKDEVIVPAFGFITPTTSVCWVGARPVFADIDPETLTLDPKQVRKSITSKTKAIIFVHGFGGHAEHINKIRDIADEHGLILIEDSAQLIGEGEQGSRGGKVGHFGCFSFSPYKLLSSFGNAGALLLKDPESAERAKWTVHYGARRHFSEYPVNGINAPIQEMQAAILVELLPHLSSWLQYSHELDTHYRSLFKQSNILQKHCDLFAKVAQPYMYFPIKVHNKDKILTRLMKSAPQYFLGYAMCPTPPHRIATYKQYVKPKSELRVGTRLSQQILLLPMHRSVSKNDVSTICTLLEDALSKE